MGQEIDIDGVMADHGAHDEFVSGCGKCRFRLVYNNTNAEQIKYWNVHVRVQDNPLHRSYDDDYAAALDWLQDNGYTETHPNFEDRSYLGGFSAWDPQKYSVIHTFRNPQTKKWAWVYYNSEERRV